MLPLVATLAMAALGEKLRDPSPGLPWFGTRPGDRFDAPLLNALTALFDRTTMSPRIAERGRHLDPSSTRGHFFVSERRCDASGEGDKAP